MRPLCINTYWTSCLYSYWIHFVLIHIRPPLPWYTSHPFTLTHIGPLYVDTHWTHLPPQISGPFVLTNIIPLHIDTYQTPSPWYTSYPFTLTHIRPFYLDTHWTHLPPQISDPFVLTNIGPLTSTHTGSVLPWQTSGLYALAYFESIYLNMYQTPLAWHIRPLHLDTYQTPLPWYTSDPFALIHLRPLHLDIYIGSVLHLHTLDPLCLAIHLDLFWWCTLGPFVMTYIRSFCHDTLDKICIQSVSLVLCYFVD